MKSDYNREHLIGQNSGREVGKQASYAVIAWLEISTDSDAVVLVVLVPVNTLFGYIVGSLHVYD